MTFFIIPAGGRKEIKLSFFFYILGLSCIQGTRLLVLQTTYPLPGAISSRAALTAYKRMNNLLPACQDFIAVAVTQENRRVANQYFYWKKTQQQLRLL